MGQFFIGVRPVFVIYSKPLGTAQQVHNIVRSGILLLFRHLINRHQTENIGTETIPCCPFDNIVNIVIIFVDHDMKIVDDFISVFFDDLDQTIDLPIQRKSLLSRCLITSAVFNGYRVGKFVVGNQFAVDIINVPARAFQSAGFCGLCGEFLCILAAVNDLEIKKTHKQYRAHPGKHQQNNR